MFPNMTPRFAIEEAAYSPALVSCTFSEMFGETDMPRRKEPLTQAELLEYVHYDLEDGTFWWKKSFQSNVGVPRVLGELATSTAVTGDGHGYLVINVCNTTNRAHRLAFLYMEGAFPPDNVDHIDHDRQNNTWANLRKVSYKKNRRNNTKQSNNTSGVTGVALRKDTGRWGAYITNPVAKRRVYLGCFDTKGEAIEARRLADIYYGYHENHGK